MILELKTQWADALISGEFKQGKGVLRSKNNYYCCLGVACELYRRVHPETSRWKETPTGPFIFVVDRERGSFQDRLIASEPVLKWLTGFDNMVPHINIDGGMFSVIQANDDLHKRFTEIAKAIRES